MESPSFENDSIPASAKIENSQELCKFELQIKQLNRKQKGDKP
jgi:predicted GIY-YIG superfamily endonuclease